MHGMSMGGATVLMASGEDLPDNVKLVISDCSYTSAYDEVAYQLKSMFGLPDKPIVPDTSKYVYEKHGFSFEEVSALKKLEKTTVPVLFIHGKADTYVPTSMVYELFTACPAEKTLYTVAGARHCESVVINTEIYWDVVKEFINHYAED